MSKSTILGLVVLGLLVAGGYWARRIDAPDSTYFPRAVACSMGRASQADQPPDITRGDCYADLDDVRFFVSVTPQPPIAFAMFTIRVTAVALAPDASGPPQPARQPLTIDGGRVRFEMSMPMGTHRYSLARSSEGSYQAGVVLPMCPSGDSWWTATIEGDVANRPRSVRLRFQLARPTS
ncbi:MAG: hypothetical protein WCP29_03060 [Acidobacteriota bacterium]